jgi:hypothetical protein
MLQNELNILIKKNKCFITNLMSFHTTCKFFTRLKNSENDKSTSCSLLMAASLTTGTSTKTLKKTILKEIFPYMYGMFHLNFSSLHSRTQDPRNSFYIVIDIRWVLIKKKLLPYIQYDAIRNEILILHSLFPHELHPSTLNHIMSIYDYTNYCSIKTKIYYNTLHKNWPLQTPVSQTSSTPTRRKTALQCSISIYKHGSHACIHGDALRLR